MDSFINELISKLQIPYYFDHLPTIAYRDLVRTKNDMYINKENLDYFSGIAVEYFHSDANIFEVNIKRKDQFLNGRPHGISLSLNGQNNLKDLKTYHDGFLTNEIINDQLLSEIDGLLYVNQKDLLGEDYLSYPFTGESCTFHHELLRVITPICNGLKSGNERIFYKSGELKISRNYRDNILHGLFECFSKDGHLLYESNFINGYTELKHCSASGKCSTEFFDEFLGVHIFQLEASEYWHSGSNFSRYKRSFYFDRLFYDWARIVF